MSDVPFVFPTPFLHSIPNFISKFVFQRVFREINAKSLPLSTWVDEPAPDFHCGFSNDVGIGSPPYEVHVSRRYGTFGFGQDLSMGFESRI